MAGSFIERLRTGWRTWMARRTKRKSAGASSHEVSAEIPLPLLGETGVDMLPSY